MPAHLGKGALGCNNPSFQSTLSSVRVKCIINMNLNSVKTIKSLCQKYHFWPRRQSGQNFLISKGILDKIISVSDLKHDDIVLEIGAGFGTLTFALAEKVKKVIAVELDKRLVKVLKNLMIVQNVENVQVVQGDVIELRTTNQELRTLEDLNYKLISNLPYNITSLVLRNFLEKKPRPSEMVMLVQKEVAERVCALPGKMSLLSVACQFFGKPEIKSYISKKNFWPRPEVDSAILKITVKRDSDIYQNVELAGIDQKKFFNVVRHGFSAKRKQLHNNLSAGLKIDHKKIKDILKECGLDPKIRAQDLSVEDWVKISKKLIKKPCALN